VANCAVIPFASPVFERDDFLVLPLFDNFSSDLCSGNNGVALRHVLPVGKHQYVAEARALTNLHIEKIDIDRVAFRDAKLPATGSDDCVSHSLFWGEKAVQNSTDGSASQTEKLEEQATSQLALLC
jgi:hypothetical protein